MPSITLFSRPARRSFPKLGRNVLPFVEMARTAERSLASPLLAYRAAETSAENRSESPAISGSWEPIRSQQRCSTSRKEQRVEKQVWNPRGLAGSSFGIWGRRHGSASRTDGRTDHARSCVLQAETFDAGRTSPQSRRSRRKQR